MLSQEAEPEVLKMIDVMLKITLLHIIARCNAIASIRPIFCTLLKIYHSYSVNMLFQYFHFLLILGCSFGRFVFRKSLLCSLFQIE